MKPHFTMFVDYNWRFLTHIELPFNKLNLHFFNGGKSMEVVASCSHFCHRLSHQSKMEHEHFWEPPQRLVVLIEVGSPKQWVKYSVNWSHTFFVYISSGNEQKCTLSPSDLFSPTALTQRFCSESLNPKKLNIVFTKSILACLSTPHTETMSA